MLLLRLAGCAVSSKLGMADQGFPAAMHRLLALGFVKVADGGRGYMITDKGATYLEDYEVKKRLRRL